MYTNIKPEAKFTPTQKAQGDITTVLIHTLSQLVLKFWLNYNSKLAVRLCSHFASQGWNPYLLIVTLSLAGKWAVCKPTHPPSGVQIGGCCSMSACVLQLEPHCLDHHQLEKVPWSDFHWEIELHGWRRKKLYSEDIISKPGGVS